jgi:hypothetical protein
MSEDVLFCVALAQARVWIKLCSRAKDCCTQLSWPDLVSFSSRAVSPSPFLGVPPPRNLPIATRSLRSLHIFIPTIELRRNSSQYHPIYRSLFVPSVGVPHLHIHSITMADASAQPKPSSSVKLVLLGEAAVGKVLRSHQSRRCGQLTTRSLHLSCASSTTTSRKTKSPQ